MLENSKILSFLQEGRPLDYRTFVAWDEEAWGQIEPIYYQAFKEKGRKTKANFKQTLENRIGQLHIAKLDSEAVAMALTGMFEEDKILLIDYLAVRADLRDRGVGRGLLNYLVTWARENHQAVGAIVEIEADPTEENERRKRFWSSCGFIPTDYVHKYIWVPEPYRAMYLNLSPDARLPEDGETLFQYITEFHRKAYRGR
jgi:GNAT superfamily N-acetyltransferase